MGNGPFLAWRHRALSAHGCVSIMIASQGGRPCRCRDWACGPGRAAESLLQLKSVTRDAAGVDMHPGQLAVSPEMVRELVDAQFPQWRSLAVKPVDSAGTLNAIFRIGDHLAARLPLEPGDPGLARRYLESEARAARELAGRTRFPTPEPVTLGEPGRGLPASVAGADLAARGDRHRGGPGRVRRVRPRPGRVHRQRTQRSAQAAGPSAGQAGEATWPPMTPGCRPASRAAANSWTSRGCAGYGTSSGNCREAWAGM